MCMNKDEKQELCFLYAGDNIHEAIEISALIETINQAMNGSVHVVMEMASDIQGYEQKKPKAEFEKYDAVFFLLRGFCTKCQDMILRQYIQYRQAKETEKKTKEIETITFLNRKCEGYIFRMHMEETEKNVKELEDLIEKETGAYMIPCQTIEIVKLCVLITICRVCNRHGVEKNLEIHNRKLWIDGKAILSTEGIPEISMNEELIELEKEMRILEEKLLLRLCMVYDFMNQWDEAAKQICSGLYEEIIRGGYISVN